ncbi:hypothetical protein OSTOST_04102, partial [Ostertagia ostertagi]
MRAELAMFTGGDRNRRERRPHSRPWYVRNEVDSRLNELLATANTGGVFLLQGPELCGKTQALCRLYDQAPATVFKIIRYGHLFSAIPTNVS